MLAIDGPSRVKDFVGLIAWSSIFESWYGAGPPVSTQTFYTQTFYTQVVRPHRVAEEWQTPTDFLDLLKQFLIRSIGAFVDNSRKPKTIIEGPDEHLLRLSDFLTRNRH